MAAKIHHGPELESEIEETCLGQFFFNMSEKHGHKICQIHAITGEKESFNSMRLRSVRTALHMQKLGVKPKDVVMVCSLNSLDSSIPVLAATYLGAIPEYLDPSLSVRDTKHLILLTKPKMIFVQKDSLSLIEDSLGDQSGPKFETVVVFGKSSEHLSFDEFLEPSGEENVFRPIHVDFHETAWMIFSSGTTGLPKAICLNHKYFLDGAQAVMSGITCDGLLHFTTMYWVTGILMLLLSFFKGGYRVLMPQFDPELTFQVIKKYKITFMMTAPGPTYQLVNLETSKDYDTSSLHVVAVGGSKTPDSQIDRVRSLFRHSLLLICYGMTEVGLCSSFDVRKHKDLIFSKPTSCGKATFGNAIKVVDPETDQILGPNQPGEVRIKSNRLMVGYHNMDSSNCFDQYGFLKSGDIGYYDEDDCFYIVDRIREMFKYQSWHIMPSVIEGVLLEHPQIIEAVVFGIPHEEFGDIPAASVVLKDNSIVSSQEISDFVAARVSDREKLRGGVFKVDCIPKTATGKIMRKRARDEVLEFLSTSKE